jgi:hypothetical protein
MNSKNTLSLMMALVLSLLLIPAAQMDLQAQAPAAAYVELDAVQLDQLVAPIALDPDSLVAQILTASTYPDQVAAADTWLNQNINLPPDQRAAGANNMSWDPAVKGLIEFPSVLDNLGKNAPWASQLGNAYYNQPGDVMNAVQAMRLQAQQSNVLVTTTQQRVVVEAGLIEIMPVTPAVIYVPYYNPWQIWGTLFVAYPGFVVFPPPPGIVVGYGLAFPVGIPVGVYAAYGWGFDAWAPAWDGGTVLFNHSTYISSSVTVFNHGYFGGHDRGVFEHGGRGVPGGFRACAHAGAARAAAGRASAGRMNGGKPSAGRTSASHAGAAGSHSAFAGRGASAGRGVTAANRGSAGSHTGATASRGASASRGSSMANRSAANRSAATRGGSSASRSAAANRGGAGASRSVAANRGSASANRGGAANRGSANANRGSATVGRGSAGASRGNSMANRGSANASRGSAMANRGGAGASHGGAMASRGGSTAGHSGGNSGHASSGGRGGHGR